jgi:hypothetical protein
MQAGTNTAVCFALVWSGLLQPCNEETCLVVVVARRAFYNFAVKEYSNREMTDKLWNVFFRKLILQIKE